MNFLTFTYYVTGRNHLLLLEKLKKRGVNLKKIEIIDTKRLKITIDSKDRLNFFAICKNSWYNKLVKVGGLFAPIHLLFKNAYIWVGIAFFLCLNFWANSLYFETQFKGDARLFSKQIEKCFDEVGIKKFHVFTQAQLNEANKKLLIEDKLSFISIRKEGNNAVVYIKQSLVEPNLLQSLNSDFIASEDMLILKISVYSGRAVVEQNAFVKKGDVIAKASYLIKEQEVTCPLVFTMSCECTFVYEYTTAYKVDDGIKANAITLAKIALGDYPVRSYTVERIDDNNLKVILKYEKTFFGG